MKKNYITASEIKDYIYCPRSWALKQLDYKPDNTKELKEGERHHEEIGVQIIKKQKENQPEIEKHNRKIITDKTIIAIIFFCLFVHIIHIFLK